MSEQGPQGDKRFYYYKFRNKLYQAICSNNMGFTDIYQINRLEHPTGCYDYLEKKYMRRLNYDEFIKYIHKNGLMLWRTNPLDPTNDIEVTKYRK